MNENKITKKLPCELTKDELESKSQALASTCYGIRIAQGKAMLESKRARDEIKELEDARDKLAEVVRSKKEYREVECAERFNYQNQQVVTIRIDTGEAVDYRAMNMSEFQEAMDLHSSVSEPTLKLAKKSAEA